MDKQQPEDFIEQIISDIMSGKPDEILPYMNDNVEIHICLGNELYSDSFNATFMGQSGLTNFLNICTQYLEFDHIKPREYHHEEGKMIVRGSLKCQMVSNGSIWTSDWMQIWTMDKDKVSKLRMFGDFHPVTRPEPRAGDVEQLRAAHH